ncbi:MAG: glyceraldehyde 3-phosphate dehydrogenase NAD-binding domain-containing protein, partial [Dehalococcoidia bacterium]|nr:glyceraldehyde 3-phosphate dehydrogenase NAD-binding domain-containing protein [Dehalococcoidia bacterium]
INGFGRIGRTVAKVNSITDQFDLVLINDINPHVENLAYLFKYDSTYGRFEGDVSTEGNRFFVNGKPIVCTACPDVRKVPWDQNDVDIVIDSSGVAKNVLAARSVISKSQVRKVVVTHSSPEVDREVIMGVNDETILREDNLVSGSICDANAIAAVLKWIDEEYGVESGALTTLHPWLSYQNLVDGPSVSQQNPGVVWPDFALGRASNESLIPKNTTAMTATEKVLPHLSGKIISFSYRVPTKVVASSDLTLNLSMSVGERDLREFLNEKCSKSKYIRANYESLISIDYEREEASGILDMQWIKSTGKTIKLIVWYDNEWGYSSRVLDLAVRLSKDF